MNKIRKNYPTIGSLLMASVLSPALMFGQATAPIENMIDETIISVNFNQKLQSFLNVVKSLDDITLPDGEVLVVVDGDTLVDLQSQDLDLSNLTDDLGNLGDELSSLTNDLPTLGNIPVLSRTLPVSGDLSNLVDDLTSLTNDLPPVDVTIPSLGLGDLSNVNDDLANLNDDIINLTDDLYLMNNTMPKTFFPVALLKLLNDSKNSDVEEVQVNNDIRKIQLPISQFLAEQLDIDNVKMPSWAGKISLLDLMKEATDHAEELDLRNVVDTSLVDELETRVLLSCDVNDESCCKTLFFYMPEYNLSIGVVSSISTDLENIETSIESELKGLDNEITDSIEGK